MDELRAQFEEQAQAAKVQASAIEDKLTNDLEQTNQTNKDLSEQLASSEVAMDKLKAALAEEQKEAKKQQKLAEDTTAQLDKMKAKVAESAQSSAANDATSRKQEELMKQVEELQVQKIPKSFHKILRWLDGTNPGRRKRKTPILALTTTSVSSFRCLFYSRTW
jgi:hypothetical protein